MNAIRARASAFGAARWLGVIAAALLGATAPVMGQDPPERRRPLPMGDLLRFTIAEIRIEGNTLLGSEELSGAVQAFLGSGRRVEDIQKVRSAILAAYRGRGYELVSVDYLPARSRDGIHYFVVREIRIGRIAVTGNRALADGSIRAQLPSLREGETPKLDRLARELFLFNDNPGARATLGYAPGGPGLSDVTVKIDEAPRQTRGAAYLNNAGTPSTGNTRLGVQVMHADFLGRGHQIGAGLTISPERVSRVFQVGAWYVLPVPAFGDSISLNASYSNVDSGRVADVFAVSGKGSSAGARYHRNLARDANSRHVLELGYDERRYRDVVDFFGVNLGASVTAKPLSLAYRYTGTFGSTWYAASALLQHNLPGGRLNDGASYAFARAGADARWQTLQLEASWQHETKSRWGIAVRGAAQLADEPLIAGEQFGLGGVRAVRGFYEREGAGDRGVRGSAEIHAPRVWEHHRFLAFTDFGRSTRINALPGERSSERLASVGLGWRSQPSQAWSLSADLAHVTQGTSIHRKGHTSLHASVVFYF